MSTKGLHFAPSFGSYRYMSISWLRQINCLPEHKVPMAATKGETKSLALDNDGKVPRSLDL